jgi:protein transport protein SEC61 subunit gamma-like protein
MDISEKTWKAQTRVEESVKRLSRGKLGRVLKMARKPDNETFKKSCMITFVMMLIVGVIGFAIYLIWTFVPPAIADFFGW